MVTQLSAAGEKNEKKCATLAEYRALPLRDKMKNSILLKWANDKTCNWQTVKSSSVVVENTVSNKTTMGYGTIFDAAKLMNMDYSKDRDLVDAILSEMPCDTDWDQENGIQRGYHKAGLKGYSLELIEMATKENKEGVSDVTTSSTSKKQKLNAVDLSLTNPVTSSEAAIQIINPEYQGMQQDNFKNI